MATILPPPPPISSSGGLPPLQYASPQDNPANTPAPKQSFLGSVGDAARDFSTGVAQSEIGLAENLGQTVLSGTDAVGLTHNASNTKFFKDPNALTSKNTAMTAGNVVGTVAPYFTGAGEEDLAAQAPGLVAKYGKTAAGIVKAIPGAVANTTIGTAQTKDPIKGVESAVGAEVGKLGISIAGKSLGKLLPSETKFIQKSAAGDTKEGRDLASRIVPKMKASVAQDKGLLVKGKPSTLLSKSKPDVVLPSKAENQAADTILKYIPSPGKLDDAQLTTVLGDKTTQIAQILEPQMKAVTIKPATIEKINADLQTLTKKQIKDSLRSQQGNVAKLQQNFQEFLQKSKSDNLNDLWTTRKAYDDSIAPNIKELGANPTIEAQLQHDLWIQNRSILNYAINDSANGLGKTSKQAFSDMTDLYSARHNLLTNAKISKGGEPSKLGQFVKDNPIKTVVGAGIAGYGLNATGIPGSIAKGALGGL